jgi:SAM-dependent methyltransferase
MSDPVEHNRRAWDQRVRENRRFTSPATDEELREPLKALDPRGWLGGSIRGLRCLCLAAGGGRQSVLYAAAGAEVTVVDLSGQMLKIDEQVARDKGLNIRTVCTTMDDLSMLADASFDLVIQPVSTCYIPDVNKTYQEVARVTRIGGVYVSQHKQPTSMQADIRRTARGYELIEPYYRTGPLPEVVGSLHREPGTREFLHRWEQLIGWMCRAGFVVEDLTEPYHADPAAKPGSWEDRSRFVAPYVRVKARRVERNVATAQSSTGDRSGGSSKLWSP